MILAAGIVYFAALVKLLVVAAVRPERAAMSWFELERRARQGDSRAVLALEREGLLDDVLSLKTAIISLLLVAISLLSVFLFGLGFGLLAAGLAALLYGPVSRLPALRRLVARLYMAAEPRLLKFIAGHRWLFALIRSEGAPTVRPARVDSREELLHLIEHSGRHLSDDERQMLSGALEFGAAKVSAIMTPRAEISSIDRKELLGPLVLDDLHRTGRSRFPVTSGSLDTIVGILDIQNLLSLDKKRSVTAEKAMDTPVYYIHQYQSLAELFAAMINTRADLFVVTDSSRRTVGIVSLKDVVSVLIGRKVTDKLDAHDNLRAVAARRQDK